MRVRAVHLALAGFGVGLLTAVPSAQQPVSHSAPATRSAVSAAPLPTIAGSWKFDPNSSDDDERNWRRPVRPDMVPATGRGRMSSRGGAGANPGRMGRVSRRQSSASSRSENAVYRALRDLLEAAESYRIAVGADSVTLTDDLDRTTSYATDGTKEKHRLGGTEFEAETTWDRGQLRQTITAGALTLSKVFLPSDDGHTLYVEIRVVKPDLKPPVKTVNRVYTRVDIQ